MIDFECGVRLSTATGVGYSSPGLFGLLLALLLLLWSPRLRQPNGNKNVDNTITWWLMMLTMVVDSVAGALPVKDSAAAPASPTMLLPLGVRLHYCLVMRFKDPSLYSQLRLKKECHRLAQQFDNSICVEEPGSEEKPLLKSCLPLKDFYE